MKTKHISAVSAVCSTNDPIVSEVVLNTLKKGGNAIDAGIAASLLQAVLCPHQTTLGGSISLLYWEAKTGKSYHLNSFGTLVPHLPPYRPIPAHASAWSGAGTQPPCACIPGYVPGLMAMHEKFGTMSWKSLCEPAIAWAETGHQVNSIEYGILEWFLPFNIYFPSGRAFFTPKGYTPRVGDIFQNADLAKTIKKLAVEGPGYFIEGKWAQHFVKTANEMGWKISLKHMKDNPPRWSSPFSYQHNGYEVLQLSPPERMGPLCAMILGVLKRLGIKKKGPFFENAETLYLMAQVYRWAEAEISRLHDPRLFDNPIEEWLSPHYLDAVAAIIVNSKPKKDLTSHLKAMVGATALASGGVPFKQKESLGSCEISIVDQEGNWLQILNTLQSGGIPGIVIDGVAMFGSHAAMHTDSMIVGWAEPKTRLSSIVGSTIVLKDGKPCFAFGSPGSPHHYTVQVLSNLLDFNLSPPKAVEAPRMQPMNHEYVIPIEFRLPPSLAMDLAKFGLRLSPLPGFDWHMGSFQICWRDPKTNALCSYADSRRMGSAKSF